MSIYVLRTRKYQRVYVKVGRGWSGNVEGWWWQAEANENQTRREFNAWLRDSRLGVPSSKPGVRRKRVPSILVTCSQLRITGSKRKRRGRRKGPKEMDYSCLGKGRSRQRPHQTSGALHPLTGGNFKGKRPTSSCRYRKHSRTRQRRKGNLKESVESVELTFPFQVGKGINHDSGMASFLVARGSPPQLRCSHHLASTMRAVSGFTQVVRTLRH